MGWKKVVYWLRRFSGCGSLNPVGTGLLVCLVNHKCLHCSVPLSHYWIRQSTAGQYQDNPMLCFLIPACRCWYQTREGDPEQPSSPSHLSQGFECDHSSWNVFYNPHFSRPSADDENRCVFFWSYWPPTRVDWKYHANQSLLLLEPSLRQKRPVSHKDLYWWWGLHLCHMFKSVELVVRCLDVTKFRFGI